MISLPAPEPCGHVPSFLVRITVPLDGSGTKPRTYKSGSEFVGELRTNRLFKEVVFLQETRRNATFLVKFNRAWDAEHHRWCDHSELYASTPIGRLRFVIFRSKRILFAKWMYLKANNAHITALELDHRDLHASE
jgi:hypothetical protein